MREHRWNNRIGNGWGSKVLLPFLMLFLVFSACTAKKEQELITVEIPENSTKLYFLNEERTKVVSESYKLGRGTVDEQVAEFLTALEEVLWTEEEKKLISEQNPIVGFVVNGTGVLTLYFASDYNTNQNITDVLRRAALVKTLCQLEGVSFVEFYIGEQPLLSANGKTLGLLDADDFIDSTGENTEFYQETQAAVYFSNVTGDALVQSNLRITYDGTVSTEWLILNQMMDGPVAEGMLEVIPEGTVLNKVSVKDGICYVDFNEKFMEKRKEISAEVTIYSIVNSLTELPNVYKVQFLINGETKKTYQNLEFSSPFERNLEIIEGEQ